MRSLRLILHVSHWWIGETTTAIFLNHFCPGPGLILSWGKNANTTAVSKMNICCSGKPRSQIQKAEKRTRSRRKYLQPVVSDSFV